MITVCYENIAKHGNAQLSAGGGVQGRDCYSRWYLAVPWGGQFMTKHLLTKEHLMTTSEQITLKAQLAVSTQQNTVGYTEIMC